MPILGADQINTGVPQVFSGPRALFMIDGNAIAYAQNVNGEEQIQYDPVDCLDLLEVKEHVPVAYRCSLNAQVFRVIGQSVKALGIFPTIQKIITSSALTATLMDQRPTEGAAKPMANFIGVRAAGHTWDTNARGIVSDNISFVAIRCHDESELP
jgi:hypothetical protein